MNTVKSLTLVAVVAILSQAAEVRAVAPAGYRQYYSGWQRYSGYYMTKYRYKSSPDHSGYSTHYVTWYPSRPRYAYYYNPYSRKYWGRYDFKEHTYSMLPEEARREQLNDIPESAFPEPGVMPPIPASDDGERSVDGKRMLEPPPPPVEAIAPLPPKSSSPQAPPDRCHR